MGSTAGNHACVYGLGWGDEGKGKVVDLLCPAFDIIVRYNGGANAGHTVCVGDKRFALHLLPTGVLHKNATGVIGPGVIADPAMLLSEIDGLAQRGIDVGRALRISDRAHLILAYHKLEDQLGEAAAGESVRIGTTARGIGPGYADKMRRRTAFRFADLVCDGDLAKRARVVVEERKAALVAAFGEPVDLDVDRVLDDLAVARERLGPYICDTTEFLHNAMDAGQAVLFEGANGLLLDVDHGTYPFVTSSSTGPYGIGAGAGVPLSRVPVLIGVAKAYATRVGSGPFVSELQDAIGDRIREKGKEYGTTTGRPRRCGWFDAVATRYSVRLGGATDVALMHLDTLSAFDRVGLCVGYRLGSATLTAPPATATHLEQAEAVVELMPGWNEDLGSVRRFEDLPEAARAYVERMETLIKAPVSLVGVGPDRTQMLVRDRLTHLIRTPEPTAT